MTEQNVFFPEPVKVTVMDRETKQPVEFLISEFVFENRIKFVKIISSISSEFLKNNPDWQEASKIEVFAALVDTAGERIGEVYELVLGKPLEWIKKNVTLRKEVEILKAIFEVNDIPFLISQLQKSLPKKEN